MFLGESMTPAQVRATLYAIESGEIKAAKSIFEANGCLTESLSYKVGLVRRHYLSLKMWL
jgi:hypothetical protein